MSDKEPVKQPDPEVEEDDEPDEWYGSKPVFSMEIESFNSLGRDKRIFSTGCADENTTLNDCFREKKDWRACKDEMEAFKQCWKRQGNDDRTDSKDAA